MVKSNKISLWRRSSEIVYPESAMVNPWRIILWQFMDCQNHENLEILFKYNADVFVVRDLFGIQ
ncbi:hypothetical protein [Cylindrospermopsis raciborskii]|uniref:hypothetical protein n=1 Tax=Cylindrospermopsis raciborskii TaxID=77022 RepID=UPI002ED859DF